MPSKEQAYILSLVKEGDVVWQDIGGELTALKHIKKVSKYKWLISPVYRSVYGKYGISFRTQYTTVSHDNNLLLPGEDFVEGVYMITSCTGQIKYIDVKKFLKCMKHNNYFLSSTTVTDDFKKTLIGQLPEYAKNELEKLVPYHEEMVTILDAIYRKSSSRCCK